jgi:hypothetical protein
MTNELLFGALTICCAHAHCAHVMEDMWNTMPSSLQFTMSSVERQL